MTVIHKTCYRTFSIIAIVASLVLIIANTIIITITPSSPAFAIKKFYNCMTDIANKSGQLSIDDITMCYDKEYHTGPFFNHKSYSTDVGSGSSSSIGSTPSQ